MTEEPLPEGHAAAGFQPTVTVCNTADDVNALPDNTLVTWIDSLEGVRQAAVVHDYEGDRTIEHTVSRSYWVDGIHMIEYPALALVWPTTNNDARLPSLSTEER